MNRSVFYLIIILFFSSLSLTISAQREAKVHGKYTYTLDDNDPITLQEAKRMCIDNARAEAMKEEFGEMITSDVIDTNYETNGQQSSSYYWENTASKVKGDWLGDTQEPVINIEYVDGKLVFTAEVWGNAREIVQASTPILWKVMRDGGGKREVTKTFNSGERIYVSFKSPAKGYLAIYLILPENETLCLLPYKNNNTGRVTVEAGTNYMFFDQETDPSAPRYKLKTRQPLEYNQVLLIYSPHPFTKCIDNVRDPRHPNSLSSREFQKWLLNCQRSDHDMVVKKEWIQIHNTELDNK